MKFIIRKCVCNVNAVPNPTQYTTFAKYNVKTKNETGPKLVRNADFAYLFAILCNVS